MLTVKSKFMQSLDSQVYIELSRLAKEKGVSPRADPGSNHSRLDKYT